MRKNNTDSLLTGGLLLMCVTNFLLYASVYMVMGVLPAAHAEVAFTVFPALLAGGLIAGPFHAYLADTFRRKHVLLWALAGIVLTMLMITHAPKDWYAWIALAQGACLALAIGAGTTISIDITLSGHRTSGNMLFAGCGRIGMVVGMVAGVWMWFHYSLTYLTYLSAACGGLALVLSALVYVSFRAPIGVSLCSADRFWLSRAWVPALNVAVLAYALGIGGVSLMERTGADSFVWALPLLSIPALTPMVVKMFVKLSHHCQRATGNMTFNLAVDFGFLAGVWTACYVKMASHVPVDASALMEGALVVAVLMYVFATRIYYKRKRVR